MNTKKLGVLLPFLLTIFVLSCSQHHEMSEGEKMEYSELLRMDVHDGYSVIDIINPWDTTRLLQRLVLAKDLSRHDLPADGVKVRVPLSRALVASTVHCSLLAEWGCLDAVKAVCDREYISVPEVLEAIDNGSITDCGPSMSPVVEKVASVHPDALFLSPYEKMDMGKLESLEVPVILCADYMESSPLGRAEWVKLYGMLFGVEEKAEKAFKATVAEYSRLKALAHAAKTTPSVLSDRAYGQTWYQPSSESTVGRMYADAGATTPFIGRSGYYGSIPLPTEEVFLKARDCDVWLVKDERPVTKAILASENKLYCHIEAYRKGNIWTCLTKETRFYEETPFHPDLLLADMIRIFHPELNLPGENRYFKCEKKTEKAN